VDVASREVGTDLGQLSNRVDDLRDEMRAGFQDVRDEMRAGFQDVRAEIRVIRTRLDTLLLATIGGLIGVIGTLAVKL
jgi:hypothetical protein